MKKIYETDLWIVGIVKQPISEFIKKLFGFIQKIHINSLLIHLEFGKIINSIYSLNF